MSVNPTMLYVDFFKNNDIIESQNKGESTMTENEIKLLEMIRTNDNPEQALITAVEVIIDFLNHHESSELKLSVGSRELV